MHTRIETRAFSPGAIGAVTPQQRIDRIREALTQERAARRTIAHGSLDEDTVSRNIADLEQLLERAEENETIRVAAKQERQAAEDAKTQAHQEREQAELESSLRQQYERAAAAPVTDPQWEKVWPDILHRHRLAEMDARDRQVAKARASGAYRI